MTIGVGVALVLVVASVCGGFRPLGMTMGAAVAVSELSCGGQSTAVGGQLSAFPEPDEPGGGQPDPAPKSPGVVQSAYAMPTGTRAAHPTSEKAAAAIRIREAFTA